MSTLPILVTTGVFQVLEVSENIQFLPNTGECNIEPVQRQESSWPAHQAKDYSICLLSLALIYGKNSGLKIMTLPISPGYLEFKLTLLVLVLIL